MSIRTRKSQPSDAGALLWRTVGVVMLLTLGIAALSLQASPPIPSTGLLRGGVAWGSTLQVRPSGEYTLDGWTTGEPSVQNTPVAKIHLWREEKTALDPGRWFAPMAVRFTGKTTVTPLDGVSVDWRRLVAARSEIGARVKESFKDLGLRFDEVVKRDSFTELTPLWPGVRYNAIRLASLLAIAAGLTLLAESVWSLTRGRAARLRRGRCPRCDFDLQGRLESGCTDCGWGRATP